MTVDRATIICTAARRAEVGLVKENAVIAGPESQTRYCGKGSND
jgi:hypothetical protein